MVGKEVCYMHGGPSLSGIAHPNFKHGLRSKYMPKRLLQKFQEAADDPELKTLNSDLAVASTRINELLTELDADTSGSLWDKTRGVFFEFMDASGDPARANELLGQLRQLITRGAAMASKWRELGEWLDRRGRLVAAETKRMRDLQLTLTAAEAGALVAALMESVKRNVEDRETLRSIGQEFARILPPDNS